MSPAPIGAKPAPPPKPMNLADDDWETESDFVNDMSERELRWGAKSVQGSGHQESFNLKNLHKEILKADADETKKRLETMPKPSFGYGGVHGVQNDRKDKCAESYEYQGKVDPHASQKDYKHGFGGQFGITKTQDKSAVGWDDHEKLQQHESQKDYKKGFGGQHGLQGKDKSAHGWDEHEKVQPHESQTDYKKGFGGKFGITKTQDKSAVGWDDHEKLQQHESQKDYKKGFGGQFGITKTQDKSAVGWDDHEKLQQHESQTDYKKGFGGQYGLQGKDKSAVGWDDHEKVQPHESQTDYKKGFGGKYGLQKNVDKSAAGYDEPAKLQQHESQASTRVKEVDSAPPKGNASSLKNRFEQLAKQQQGDKVQEERERRKREDEELRKQQEQAEQERQAKIDQKWQQMDAAGGDAGAPHVEEERPRVSPPKQKANIGVRLPFAVEKAPEPEVQPSYEEPPVVEEQAPQEPQPRVPIFPGMTLPPSGISGMVPKRGDTDEEDNDDWEDEKPAKVPVVIPQSVPQYDEIHEEPAAPPVPQFHTLPQYEAPPETAPEPLKGPSAPAQYDYVPDDIPSPVPQQQPQQHPLRYEEPPYHEIPENAAISQQQHPAQTSQGLCAIALFDYEQQEEDELGFVVNDTITDIEQIDEGWWRGKCKGRIGLFPSNYVQTI